MKQDGTPSNLRALFAYGLGLQVDGALKVSKIVVLDKNEEVASEADTQAYALEYSKLRKAEIQPDQATMKVAGFKHVPDLAAIEGKYIAASLAVDGDYNKVVGLSKVPMSFDASAVNASYAEEITKFNDVVYPRIIEARKKKASARTQGADNIAPDFAVTESSISLDDIPF